ncbi:MAG: tetraacyldisaccharide 4'-kinase [Chitinispirillaceae bacterium]
MKNNLKPIGNTLPARCLAAAYGCAVMFRNRWYDTHRHHQFFPSAPTISVGGIHAGGTGKTPLTALIAEYLLTKRHLEVAILSRGYGRRCKEPVIIQPYQDADWTEVGDEPAMIHASLPQTLLGVGASRTDSCYNILNNGQVTADRLVFVLDDGFQHRRIARHLDIVCLPPMERKPHLIPAGYLREPVKNMRRADLACIIASKNDLQAVKWTQSYIQSQLGSGFPIIILLSRPFEWVNLQTGEKRKRLKEGNWGLISGIAHPQRFIKTVKNMGIFPTHTSVFPDHHVFTRNEIESILKQNTTGIMTTEKDASRMRTLKLVNRKEIWYLKISLEFSDTMARDTFFKKIDSILSFSRNRRNPS